jgi:RNA recognition motif-containing protein
MASAASERPLVFEQFGSVHGAIMRDMATGGARGFGFVEMITDEEAQTPSRS